ncbi:MAG: hypothetical protein HYX65_08575 [Gemmatimonadetes bacterium]|nr:hypothetical protein [Gemmatimonadota bacterium]
MRRAAAALLVVVAACGDRKASRDSSATVPVPVVTGNATPVAAPPAGSMATGTVPCTVGALWDECAVIKRIEQQGLVPRLDTTTNVRAAGFSIAGRRVMLGRGELVFFLYADTLQRAHDTAALDTLTVAPRGQSGAWSTTPTLVVSRNVAVVLLSKETNVKIRITDAFTAGLPALERR